jgi:hypothetical protein
VRPAPAAPPPSTAIPSSKPLKEVAMTQEEEDALHEFCLRLSRRLLCLVDPESQTDRLWQSFYQAIRADLERFRASRTG